MLISLQCSVKNADTLWLLIFFLSPFFLIKSVSPLTTSTKFPKNFQNLREPSSEAVYGSIKLESLGKDQVIVRGNNTLLSLVFLPQMMNKNGTWACGMLLSHFPTYVWVANREKLIKNLFSARAEITENGRLAVMDQESRALLWQTNNVKKASVIRLLEQGNLVLLSSDGRIVWQSFDLPTDTWLTGMNLTAGQIVTSWRAQLIQALEGIL